MRVRYFILILILLLGCKEKVYESPFDLEFCANNTDNCGVCDNDPSNDCIQDCAGTWGGNFVNDECGASGCCDCDGNIYETVQIGEQLWMAENLKVAQYNNGAEIPTGYSNNEWEGLFTGAYAVYDNNSANADIYGNLYNWFTVEDERGICPAGWHMPLDDEWTILFDYLGGESKAGDKMKEKGNEHWSSYNTGASNESGFNALPGGQRMVDASDVYHMMGGSAHFWTSKEFDSNYAMSIWLSNIHSNAQTIKKNKNRGHSIRCLKDLTPLSNQ